VNESEAEKLYTERAQCVIALARAASALGCRVGFREDPDLGSATAQWPVLFIDLPTGQVSWHLTVEDRRSAVDIGAYLGEWDRHDTPEKYRRLAAWQPEGLYLTEEQQHWCKEHDLGIGFDDDNPKLNQFCHVCETLRSEDPDTHRRNGDGHIALCRSPRLWFGQGRGYRWIHRDCITCARCIVILAERGCPGL